MKKLALMIVTILVLSINLPYISYAGDMRTVVPEEIILKLSPDKKNYSVTFDGETISFPADNSPAETPKPIRTDISKDFFDVYYAAAIVLAFKNLNNSDPDPSMVEEAIEISLNFNNIQYEIKRDIISSSFAVPLVTGLSDDKTFIVDYVISDHCIIRVMSSKRAGLSGSSSSDPDKEYSVSHEGITYHVAVSDYNTAKIDCRVDLVQLILLSPYEQKEATEDIIVVNQRFGRT